MKHTLSRRERRVLRRASVDQTDKAPVTPRDADTAVSVAHSPAAARFDPSAIAAAVAEQWVGVDGRRRYLATADGLTAPDPSGRWLPADDAAVVLDLQLAAVAAGPRLLPARLDAVRAELDALLWADGRDMWPHVDAEQVCAPTRPHGAPATWQADQAARWVADFSYGPAGRYLASWSGQTYGWVNGAWQVRPGDDDWLTEIVTPGLGNVPDDGLVAEVRRLLAVPFSPADPGAVAEHDMLAAISTVTEAQRRAYESRRDPRTHRMWKAS